MCQAQCLNVQFDQDPEFDYQVDGTGTLSVESDGYRIVTLNINTLEFIIFLKHLQTI